MELINVNSLIIGETYYLKSNRSDEKKEWIRLKGIFVSAASSTPTITIYDVQTGTATTMVGVFTPAAATFYSFGPADGMFFNNGLNIAISGTVTATVIYE